MSQCSALSRLTGLTPTAPTCCWTYGTETNTTAVTSLAVGAKNMKRQAHSAENPIVALIISLPCSAQFPHCHVISDNEPLHQRSAGIRILQCMLHFPALFFQTFLFMEQCQRFLLDAVITVVST